QEDGREGHSRGGDEPQVTEQGSPAARRPRFPPPGMPGIAHHDHRNSTVNCSRYHPVVLVANPPLIPNSHSPRSPFGPSTKRTPGRMFANVVSAEVTRPLGSVAVPPPTENPTTSSTGMIANESVSCSTWLAPSPKLKTFPEAIGSPETGIQYLSCPCTYVR